MSDKSFCIFTGVDSFLLLEKLSIPALEPEEDAHDYHKRVGSELISISNIEGICLDSDATLYITGEGPVSYFRFEHQNRKYAVFTHLSAYLCTDDGKTNTVINKK